MKHFKLLMLGFGLVLTLVLVVQPAQASRTYHRTPTTATAQRTYYTTNSTSHTFRANGNYNRWTFRANHDLKNYHNTIWTTVSKTYITMNGKPVLYYWVRNSRTGVSGWIWHGYLKPIQTYKRTRTTPVAHKTYYTTDTRSHTFRANGNYNYWTFKANHDLKNYRNTTWTTTHKTYITMNGKPVLYYWVRNSRNGASGWIWHGYLKSRPTSEASLVSRLKVAPRAQQIVTVVQNGRSTATLRLWQKNANSTWQNTLTSSSRIGPNGIGRSHEGSSTTPIGVYHLSFAFGKAAHATTGGMSYRQIKRNTYWIEDIHDKQYNTWQSRSWANNKNEHLIDYTRAAPYNQYQLAVVMDNHGQNNGSGFFIHVRNQWATAGCVSISLGDMQRLVSRLGRNAYVVDVQNLAQLSNY